MLIRKLFNCLGRKHVNSRPHFSGRKHEGGLHRWWGRRRYDGIHDSRNAPQCHCLLRLRGHYSSQTFEIRGVRIPKVSCNPIISCRLLFSRYFGYSWVFDFTNFMLILHIRFGISLRTFVTNQISVGYDV